MSLRRIGGAAVALLLLAAVATGCGGGSNSPSEASLRRKLTAAAQKLADAKSLRASVLFEVEEEGESEELGCVIVSVDNHGKPERADVTFFDENCSGGVEAHELVAVGRRAWASSSDSSGSWTEAKIAPAVLDELDDERTDPKDLIAAAEDIYADPDGASVEEGNEVQVEVPAYYFDAPASAFPGADADLEDVEVEFKAVLDRKGNLREIVVHGDENGTGATVTENYDEIDKHLGIGPPDPSDVHGKATTIRSQSELDRLFGISGQ